MQTLKRLLVFISSFAIIGLTIQCLIFALGAVNGELFSMVSSFQPFGLIVL